MLVKHKKLFCKIMDIDETEITDSKKLAGGRTNHTYYVEVGSRKYTFRIPGEDSEKFIDRKHEQYNLKIAEEHGLVPRTFYCNPETGVKVSKYIEGVNSETQPDLANARKIASLLKSIHQSESMFVNDYEPFGRLKKYEKFLLDFNHKKSAEYMELRTAVLSQRDFLECSFLQPCHCDCELGNILVGNNKYFLVDWEFAGNNDPIYDIACFDANGYEFMISIFEIYSNHTNDEFKRLHLWRALQCLQWYNVAMYKNYSGLNTKMKLDFKKIADDYLVRAREMIELASQY